MENKIQNNPPEKEEDFASHFEMISGIILAIFTVLPGPAFVKKAVMLSFF